MKILKRVAIAVAVIIAIPFVVALFLKKSFVVERTVTINRPRNEVFDYVKQLKHQEKFSKWATLDPKMKTTYRGNEGEVGSVMAWESASQDVGKGELEIKQIVPGERVDLEIRMKEPFQSTDPTSMTTQAIDEKQTKVTSVYVGKFAYPMNLLCLMVEEKIGKDMETGLVNLKGILEKP